MEREEKLGGKRPVQVGNALPPKPLFFVPLSPPLPFPPFRLNDDDAGHDDDGASTPGHQLGTTA